jgi:tetratricopeptide (TPR) repeat protein
VKTSQIQQRNKEITIHDFDKAIEIDPQRDDAWYTKGSSFDEMGKYDEAIASFDKALEINPDHTKAKQHKSNAVSLIAQNP